MFKLFKYLKARDWILLVVCVGLIVLQVWLELTMPDYTKEITELVVAPGGTMKAILKAGGKMLGCALGSMASAITVMGFTAVVSASFARNLREALFNKVESFSMQEINRFSTASLITRSTNDVVQVQMVFVMGLQSMIKAPIMAIWAITKIAQRSWQWMTVVAGAVGLMVITMLIVVIFALPMFRKIQTLTDNINRITRENLTGVRVVRAYNAEQYQEDKFEKANHELTRNHLITGRIMSLMNPVMTIIMQGMSLAIYWIGSHLINNADSMASRLALFGDMTSFMAYGMSVVMAFMMLVMIFIMLPRALVSSKRINEVLDLQPSITDPENPVTPDPSVVGEIEFKNVSFKYPDADEYVIENVSFKAKKGDTVAFIGATGSGKSTLINLVPRFYDVTEGEVLVDGVNVRDYSQEELHRKLGYVPQRAILFSGTVDSNVNYGHGAEERTIEDVKRAVEIAQGSFVLDMEGQYYAPIAQGGTNVSGGQKQRLSIARAVIRNPEIFIFDDSFSALDYKTDRVLRSALNAETGDATRLIVAQRIGTILDADNILVLDEGKVVGQGTHSQLMESCEVYRQIAYSQLSKEEL